MIFENGDRIVFSGDSGYRYGKYKPGRRGTP